MLMKIKRITFDNPSFGKVYYFLLGVFLTIGLVFLDAMSNPKFETYNGYMMNFAGELIQVEKFELKAEEIHEITFEEYVQEKFGKDAWKAFAILHGTKYCGGENGRYNPNAINTAGNTPEGSRDRGYWQFNDHWHPEISDECARDIKCSTDRAYEIFKRDKGFAQWSAGKCLGL